MDGTQASSHLCRLAGLYQCEGKLPVVVGVPLCLGSRHVLPSDGDAEMTRRLDDRSAVALEKRLRQDLGFRIQGLGSRRLDHHSAVALGKRQRKPDSELLIS